MSELKELMLRAPRLTLAVAESLTSGHVQARVGAISGASNFFLGGMTAYTLEQKVRHLGVDRAAAAAVDCVSPQVAEQMARGVAILFGADLGLATTGYAEPAADQGVVAPYAWWALAHHTAAGWQMMHRRVDFPGAARVAVQQAVAAAVVDGLIDYLRTVR